MLNARRVFLVLLTLSFAHHLQCSPAYDEQREFFEEEVLELAKTQKTNDQIDEFNPSQYISDVVWEQVREFILPNNHPTKTILDKIFSSSRAFCDLQTMNDAGFEPAIPQHHTQIIVTRHPLLKGYIIKAYLDVQDYHSGKPEYYFWIKRITGARLIRSYIIANHLEHFFKVPKKWIYLLPDVPLPPQTYIRKNFILVEEDMNIYDDLTNEQLWGSSLVTKPLLKSFYRLLKDLGLCDCAKPANCPFSKDGKIALVDTQSYQKKHVKYHKLTPYLSPTMKSYWKKLIDNN